MYKVALAYPHNIASNHLLFRGINEYAQTHPIFEFRYFADTSEAGLKELMEWKGDGAIVSLDSEHAIQQVKGANLAMVNVSNAVDDNTVPRVYRDHTEIGMKAAEYLANLGVNELAFVGIANRHYSQMKWQAFEATAKSLVKPTKPFFMESTSELLTEEKMIRDFIYWLKSLHPPVGLLLDEDALYSFVYQICKRCSLRIPEDIAIISVNNSQSCSYQEVPLSSFQHNNKDYGIKVMQTLHALIEDRAAPEGLDIAIQGVDLHERESSNILHCKDTRLSTTIKYIKANLNRTFTIEELLQEVGCSRRTIENLIKSERGSTLHDYIIHEKVKRVKQVFKSNSYIEPVRLASLTGFSSSRHLQDVFKRTVGYSLEEYAIQKSKDKLD
jgi:LacI family transcriptional regulator